MPLIIRPTPFQQRVLVSNPLITTTNLPTALVGSPYGDALAASGGYAPYTWTILSDTGSGLSISPSTGQLSGTPASIGTFTLVIGLTDANGVGAQTTLTLSVVNPLFALSAPLQSVLTACWSVQTVQPPMLAGVGAQFKPPTITVTPTLAAATQYASHTGSWAASGGTAPYTFTATPLQIYNQWTTSATGISGTPNLPMPTETWTVQATDAHGYQSVPTTVTLSTNYVVPAGAQALGYTQLIWMVLNPTTSNVNLSPTYGSTNTAYDFFAGYFGYSGTSYTNIACIQNVNGVLQLQYNTTGTGGQTDMMGAACTSSLQQGQLAPLSNGTGYYVDFGIDYTSWTSDCFGAVWLQSIEFNLANPSATVNPAQTAYLKQYLENDVWEGGSLGPATGYQGALVYHNGVTGTQSGSNYTIPHFTNPTQTIPHVYGSSWNPNGTATYYVDNVETGSYSILSASNGGNGGQCNATSLAWLNTQHMYPLWSMQSHGAATPYAMNFYYIAAFGPPTTNGNLEIPFPQTLYGSVGTEMLYTLTAIAAKSGITVTAPITWSISGGGAIDSSGDLTFTPASAGTFTLTVTAVDSSTPTANSGQATITCIVS